jgi:hypothetical protein
MHLVIGASSWSLSSAVPANNTMKAVVTIVTRMTSQPVAKIASNRMRTSATGAIYSD